MYLDSERINDSRRDQSLKFFSTGCPLQCPILVSDPGNGLSALQHLPQEAAAVTRSKAFRGLRLNILEQHIGSRGRVVLRLAGLESIKV
jgi:hypothetical protein